VTRARRLGLAATVAVVCAGVVATTLQAAPDGKRRQSPQTLEKDFDIVTLADGLEQPSGLDYLPDGTLLVTEKAGKLWAIEPDGDRKLVLDITAHVSTPRERGLNGVAVDADFANTRRVYLLYAFKVNDGPGAQAMRLTSIGLNPDHTVINPGSPERVILGKDAGPGEGCPPISKKRDCPPSINSTHQGGTIISAPDGTLWVGFGDSNLPSNPGAQTFRTFDPDSTSGKILHIDPSGNGLGDHPFCRKVKNLAQTCTKVFATGFRNPFRFTIGPNGRPVVGDVGWNAQEEIDLVRPGRNYGWPCFEGKLKTQFYSDMARCRALYRKAKKEDVAAPVYSYKNPPGMGANGAAVIVGPHNSGGSYPAHLTGGFFYGDYAKGFIGVIKIKKGRSKTFPLVTGVGPVGFDTAPDGNVAFTDFITGAVRKLVYSPNNKAPTAKIFASPTSGPGPNMLVNFSALDSTDPDGDPLQYDWDFDDGSPHDTSGGSVSHVYTANGEYNAKLTITDDNGAIGQAQVKILVGNTRPQASVISPSAATLSQAGAPVTLEATGTDAEDGVLPPSAFTWKVELFHKQHVHPLGNFTGSPAAFEAARDHDSDSHYEVTLTVTDSGGASVQLPPVTVNPQVAPLKILSRPRGVELSYAGREVKTSKKVMAAVGFAANLAAPAEIKIGGTTYNFDRWSQGGRRVQIYTVPARKSTIRAIYKKDK
jgi:glucose/arabinose dehydrogenase